MFLDGFDDVLREEGLAVVLADVAVGDEAGFAAQVAGELAAEVVLDDDGVAGVAEDVEDGVAVERDEPADGEMVDGDALLAEEVAGFVDDAVGGAPADEGDVGVGGAAELRRGDGGGDAVHLAHAFFHHGAALGVVGVGVGDEDAVFVVLVGGDDVGVAGDAGDDARGDAAVGDLVAEVLWLRWA